jgi:hypothetical protein
MPGRVAVLSLSLVFHAFAAAVFVALVFKLAKTEAQSRFVVALLESPWREGRVQVDWPRRFVRNLARSLRIDADLDGGVDIPPARIDTAPWVRLHISHGILAVALRDGSPCELRVKVAQCPDDPDATGKLLSAALGGSMSVVVQTEREQA